MAAPAAPGEVRSFEFETFMPSLGRSALAAGIASLVGGLAAGVAVRLAMRAVALLEPDATGQLTENGAVIGAITVDGSLFLVLFGAMFGTLIGSAMVAAFAGLVPGPIVARGVLFGLAMLLVFGSGLVTAGNRDFADLATPLANVALFSTPFLVAGFVAFIAHDVIAGRLPPAGARGGVDQGYVLVASFGVLLVLLTVMSLAANAGAPFLLLSYLAVVAYALVRHGVTASWVPAAGRVLLAALCLVGGALDIAEVASILGRG
jgi:hypothetical protein